MTQLPLAGLCAGALHSGRGPPLIFPALAPGHNDDSATDPPQLHKMQKMSKSVLQVLLLLIRF
jgi:hypothetical protein